MKETSPELKAKIQELVDEANHIFDDAIVCEKGFYEVVQLKKEEGNLPSLPDKSTDDWCYRYPFHTIHRHGRVSYEQIHGGHEESCTLYVVKQCLKELTDGIKSQQRPGRVLIARNKFEVDSYKDLWTLDKVYSIYARVSSIPDLAKYASIEDVERINKEQLVYWDTLKKMGESIKPIRKK